jgi:hypothetical protein
MNPHRFLSESSLSLTLSEQALPLGQAFWFLLVGHISSVTRNVIEL